MKTEWIFVVVFLAISLFLNCDAGRARVNFTDLTVNIQNGPAIRWGHGWPAICFGREGVYSAVSGKSIYPPADYARLGGFEEYSRYPIDRAPVIYHNSRNAVFNFMFVMLAAFGIYRCTKRLNDLGRLRLQFQLRSALIAILVISVLLATRHLLPDTEWIVQVAILLTGILTMAVGILTCLVEGFLRVPRKYSRRIRG